MQYMLFLIEVIKKVWGVHFKGIIDENIGKYEIDFLVTKKKLDLIIRQCFNALGTTETVKMLDHIKEIFLA